MFVVENRHQSLVSIVIPVYNRWDLTRQCLESLWKHTLEGAAEIIVVDNGSNDGTAEELRDLQEQGRIQAIINEEDLGFARACNMGATAASHPYVLFLNNNTEVTPGWLEPLVATLDLDSMVGAVGSRMLFPDGTIRHAGMAIVEQERQSEKFLDVKSLCDRKPADFPPANKPQLMRSLSDACLLVRRDVFEDLGGFDTGYRNGFEAVDHCLTLSEQGWNLVYQPESLVVHYESQSGEKQGAHVQHNYERLNDRWYDKIAPDYYVDNEGVYTPAPEFSIRTYAQPRLVFKDSAPKVDDKPIASVVILTHNALEYTSMCVDSLLAHTDKRHELIFVDNGSTDGTVKYLRNLCDAESNCFAIYNNENLGFAAGNNQGIAFASGEFTVLLNSDTVVTEHWLETLIQAAVDHPQAGLVGPMTNSIVGPQQLPKVGYDQKTLSELDIFSRMHCSATRGNDELVLWLNGFCLLMRRDLVTRIGGLDERFGLGNFEDNDFCLRSFLAGYQALIATDCFVHHFGSKSFEAAGIDYDADLKAKWEIFKAKWNIPLDTPYGKHFDLERIMVEGFDPVLHFHPLPMASTVQTITPREVEMEDVLIRGEDAFDQQRPDAAETLFRWVLQWDETNSRAANNLAVTLWQLRRTDEAVSQLQSILSRDPDDADAIWNLQEIRKAVKEANQIPSTAPDNVPVEDTTPRDVPVA